MTRLLAASKIVCQPVHNIQPVSGLVALTKPTYFRPLAAEVPARAGFTDNASVTLLPSARSRDQLLATTETVAGTFRIDRDSLETQGRVTYRDALKGKLTTAHPGHMKDGWSVNIAVGVPDGKIEVFRYRVGDDVREVLHEVQSSNGKASWMHDLAVSENYLALVEMPVYSSAAALMGISKADHVFADWVPENGTVITLLPLAGGGAKKQFRLPAFFVFHFANTFEADVPGLGPCVCIDCPMAPDASVLSDLLLERMRNARGNIGLAEWKRILLPLTGDGDARIEDLVQDHASYGRYAELPCINPAYDQREYSFIYAGSVTRPSQMINQVSKFDVRAKRLVSSWRIPGGFPLCEPKFVARPGSTAEDDGVLLAPFMDASGRSLLAVLDGKDLSELARCYTPEAVMMGFHSTFVPSEAALHSAN